MSANVLVESSARRPRIKFWPLGSLPLSVVVMWAINTGGEALRWLVLGGFASAMLFCLLFSLEACMTAMILFQSQPQFANQPKSEEVQDQQLKSLNEFQKQNPDITVKITQTAWSDYWTGISTGFVSGSASEFG